MFSTSSAMPAGRCCTGESSCDIFTGAPHALHNFVSSGKGFPHFEQNIISTPLACRRQKQPQLIFHSILPEATKKRPTQSGSFQKKFEKILYTTLLCGAKSAFHAIISLSCSNCIHRLEQFVRFEIAHTVAIVTVVGILADTKPVSSGLCRNCGFICVIV